MLREQTTTREKGRRRDEILDAALRVLARSGYDGLSLQAVADSVGIRKPSLLYHFESKAALRNAVLEQMLTRWNEVLPRVLRAATAGPEQLHAVLRETMAFFSADPDRARVLLREGLDRPEEFRALIAGHVRPWAEIACSHIESGRAKSRVHADVDAEAYVAVLVNAMVSLIATAPYMSAFVPGSSKQATARLEAEFLRFAHAALFVPRQAAPEVASTKRSSTRTKTRTV